MTDIELRDELMTMLAAGHETTATGLAFAFDLLLRNPARARPAARRAGGGDDAYLDAVVTETLRLRPVIDAARAHADQAAHDRRLGPAGRHPRLSGDRARPPPRGPLPAGRSEFRPERFLDGGAESYSWLPFGGGIRRCIGAALAQAEMAEVIRTVVSRVDLEPARPDPEPVVMRGITLVPRHGTPVVVRRVAQATPKRGMDRAAASSS